MSLESVFLLVMVFRHFQPNSASYCDMILDASNYEKLPRWSLKTCDLHYYHHDDVTACLQTIAGAAPNKAFQLAKARNDTPLHNIVFVGDSRMRQQYLTLTRKYLPRYDLVWKPSAASQLRKFNYDAVVQSQVLDARLSFKWRHVLDQNIEHDLRTWISDPSYRSTPTLVVIGVAIHAIYLTGLEDYTRNLTRLEPLIRKLASVTDVIWWIQDPVIDKVHEMNQDPFNSPLVSRYNSVAKRILKDSGVRFWDSSRPLGMEYVRSCSFISHKDSRYYRHCYDPNHMGFSVVQKTIHLLLNFYCNGFLSKNLQLYPSLRFTNTTCCFS